MSEKKETKVVNKTTVKKTTTPKVATAKKTVEKKEEKAIEQKKDITINDIPKNVLDQLTQQILTTINESKQVKENEIKSSVNTKPIKYTKAYLNSNESIRKELIELRSIYNGGVNFVSNRTKMVYKWLEKGSVEYLTVEELLAMESSSLRFLHTPWLVVEDKRIIEAFKLEELYSIISEVEDLEIFLENDIDYIEEIVNKLPMEFKTELISDIYKGLKDKTLRIDYLVLQKLQDLLNYDFME